VNKKIEGLARYNPIIRNALNLHLLKGVPYQETLELMITTLVEQQEITNKLLIECMEKSTVQSISGLNS